MAANSTMTASSASAPSTDSTSSDWGWCKLPLEIKDMIFEYIDFPTVLHIQVHHFKPKKRIQDGSRVKYAVEVLNKGEWRDMLRLQVVKEIDADILQPLFVAKEMVIRLDIAGHPNEGEVWEGIDPGFSRGLNECIQDWPAFLEKFPFRRMQTGAPYILRLLNPAERLRDLATEEVHYLQLTYDEVEPEPWQEADPNTPNHWAVKKYAWKKAQEPGMTATQTQLVHNGVESGFSVVAQHFFQFGLSAEDLGRLQERLAALPSKVHTKDFQLSSWSAGIMSASGLMDGILDPFISSREARVTPLKEIVWEKVEI